MQGIRKTITLFSIRPKSVQKDCSCAKERTLQTLKGHVIFRFEDVKATEFTNDCKFNHCFLKKKKWYNIQNKRRTLSFLTEFIQVPKPPNMVLWRSPGMFWQEKQRRTLEPTVSFRMVCSHEYTWTQTFARAFWSSRNMMSSGTLNNAFSYELISKGMR